jgi:hypothetical protein
MVMIMGIWASIVIILLFQFEFRHETGKKTSRAGLPLVGAFAITF